MENSPILLLVLCTLVGAGQPSKTIPAPHINALNAQDKAIGVSWSKVEGVYSDEPIIGYVVKVWEIPDVTAYKYEIVDGKKVLVSDKKEPKVDPKKIPNSIPREIKVDGADVTAVDVDNVKDDVLYHIRVQAFTKTEKGALSDAATIKLISNENKS
ncbi:uncharacterized protein LOC128201736 [Galleria mellonella]|uniref:Uncharacterized protein LOC128201736 n=1 Tax=Galleria mellonella TaxID=7137 RepID=A0ABM3MVY4_GALME|nr:uncharacterized protein LOC128201736 [Galleria mellonella]